MIYIITVTPMELNVPMGMALRGFFNSPDILTPTIIPVTAGKKTAKTYQKSASSNFPMRKKSSLGAEVVKKMEIIDNPIIIMIIYWIFIANFTLTYEIISKTAQAVVEIRYEG